MLFNKVSHVYKVTLLPCCPSARGGREREKKREKKRRGRPRSSFSLLLLYPFESVFHRERERKEGRDTERVEGIYFPKVSAAATDRRNIEREREKGRRVFGKRLFLEERKSEVSSDILYEKEEGVWKLK